MTFGPGAQPKVVRALEALRPAISPADLEAVWPGRWPVRRAGRRFELDDPRIGTMSVEIGESPTQSVRYEQALRGRDTLPSILETRSLPVRDGSRRGDA